MTMLTVGAGQKFSTISAAVAASRDGDTVQVQAGTYVNDFATVNTKITIQGIGGMAHLVATIPPPDGKAILTTNTDVTLDHLEFSGAAVADRNGAGVRYQGGNLTVTNSYFHDNENGILGNASPTGTVTIRNSEFSHNGEGSGSTHNIYIGDIASLTIDSSYFHDAVVGHEIKSRAENTTITNSRIQDGATATSSYSIDTPNGGNVLIQGNVIQQGPASQNPVIIAFGEEGSVHANSTLNVLGNTILNDLQSPSLAAVWNATGAQATLTGNAIFGVPAGQMVRGNATMSGNLTLPSEPALVTTSPWVTATTAPSVIVTPTPTPTPVPVPTPTPAPAPTPLPATAPASGAYVFEGPTWASHTITWSFASSTYSQDAATPFSSSIGAAYQSTVQQAVQRWAAASGLNLVQQTDTTDPTKAANIRIGFADLGTATSNQIGYTSYRDTASGTGALTFSGDTVVRLEDPSKDPLTAGSGGSLTYQGYTTTLYQTILHEFGHALGLDHSKDASTVMYPTLGAGNPDLGAGDIAGIQALYGTLPSQSPTPTPVPTSLTTLVATSTVTPAPTPVPTPTPVPVPTPTPVPTPAPVPTPTPAATASLVLSLSEDAYKGDAQFTVSVDGQQLGAAQSVTAQHGTGSQAFNFAPSLTPGTHQVSIAFVNDLWNPGVGDRNLYVEGITLGGVAVPVSNGALYSNGSVTATVTEPSAASSTVPTTTPVPTPAPTPASTDSLVLSLSEDAYKGDAQFTVSVDGQQLAGAVSVTALHGAGAPQEYSFAPSLTPGTHQVSIAFVNDLWNPGVGDRNLYVEGITLGGVAVPVSNGALYSNGSVTATVTEPTTPTPVPTPTPVSTPITSDTLVLNLSEDAFQGDAQFTVSVDGKSLGAAQTVTALHGAGASQAFTFNGQFGPGAHDLAVTFTNDKWNPGIGDRNLYVDGATLNGTASASTGSITLLDGTHAAHMMIGTASV